MKDDDSENEKSYIQSVLDCVHYPESYDVMRCPRCNRVNDHMAPNDIEHNLTNPHPDAYQDEAGYGYTLEEMGIDKPGRYIIRMCYFCRIPYLIVDELY